MNKPTVLIEARPFCLFDNAPYDKLKKENLEIIDMRGSGADNPDFIEAMKRAHLVLCGNNLMMDNTLFELAGNLKAVAKMGAGLDTVDIDAATRHGVIVFYTPGVNNQAVADHTFALMLSAARKIILCDKSLREGRWEQTKIMGLEIWEKTLGLIGLGAIGRSVALRARGFNMRIVAHDPFWPDEFAEENNIERMEIDEILKIADIVSIHAPLIQETSGMIDMKALKIMKPTALLINAARGGIVKEDDLYEALKQNIIAGAGIDVFENEPPSGSRLFELDNVVVTPHTATFTRETMNKMNTVIVDEIIDFFKGKKPGFVVNPEVPFS